jgi:hypothetical protein
VIWIGEEVLGEGEGVEMMHNENKVSRQTGGFIDFDALTCSKHSRGEAWRRERGRQIGGEAKTGSVGKVASMGLIPK